MKPSIAHGSERTPLVAGPRAPRAGMEQFLRRKPLFSLADAGPRRSPSELRPVLRVSQLLLFGVGCIIGAGIFTLVGEAAREAGPALSVSMVVVGLCCSAVALAYCELAASIPVAGSAYLYCSIYFGELPAWLTACSLLLELGVGAALVARSWATYLFMLVETIGVPLPEAIVAVPINHALELNVLASCLVLMVTSVAALGVNLSAALNAAVVCLKL